MSGIQLQLTGKGVYYWFSCCICGQVIPNEEARVQIIRSNIPDSHACFHCVSTLPVAKREQYCTGRVVAKSHYLTAHERDQVLDRLESELSRLRSLRPFHERIPELPECKNETKKTQ
jgi:hypothetical protein